MNGGSRRVSKLGWRDPAPHTRTLCNFRRHSSEKSRSLVQQDSTARERWSWQLAVAQVVEGENNGPRQKPRNRGSGRRLWVRHNRAANPAREVQCPSPRPKVRGPEGDSDNFRLSSGRIRICNSQRCRSLRVLAHWTLAIAAQSPVWFFLNSRIVVH